MREVCMKKMSALEMSLCSSLIEILQENFKESRTEAVVQYNVPFR